VLVSRKVLSKRARNSERMQETPKGTGKAE